MAVGMGSGGGSISKSRSVLPCFAPLPPPCKQRLPSRAEGSLKHTSVLPQAVTSHDAVFEAHSAVRSASSASTALWGGSAEGMNQEGTPSSPSSLGRAKLEAVEQARMEEGLAAIEAQAIISQRGEPELGVFVCAEKLSTRNPSDTRTGVRGGARSPLLPTVHEGSQVSNGLQGGPATFHPSAPRTRGHVSPASALTSSVASAFGAVSRRACSSAMTLACAAGAPLNPARLAPRPAAPRPLVRATSYKLEAVEEAKMEDALAQVEAQAIDSQRTFL